MSKTRVLAAGFAALLGLTLVGQAVADEPLPQALQACKASMAALPESPPAGADPATLFCFGVRALSRNPNDPAAAAYALPAAKAGYAPAQDMVAGLYELGAGVTMNKEKALDWYHKAAEQGSREAQNDYAVLLYDGWPGHAPRYAEAVKWLRKSADQGLPEAQVKLAEAYYYGNGVAADPKLAFQLYNTASASGNLHAMYVLGFLYISGEGTAADPVLGARWTLKAAEANSGEAQLILAQLYMMGTGVEADSEAGLMWYDIALRNGEAGNPALADRLKSALSGEAVARAQGRADANWLVLSKQPKVLH